ncbi:DUF5340 domain-containing protein [Leptolyngbya sp. NK1-12]|uniref:DUF5340 domain-containing protein n=1 Tax=Leptolyngbya sp. NK1-12 TaxID=2547451 RepID=A0AA96WA77_9CYAN|nr:DUF5340 domain-containing protein [Leptolyngbya sp. NK1-12]WNZ21514.1 DUF5340 domain-containing protein [Leptolyngbya sp. NK1-12]
MDPIPLPSHIHYELLLQLLERQTMHAIGRKSPQQEQLHELIVTLRKAFTQQKQLEESCERASLPVDYRWSLNQAIADQTAQTPSAPAAPNSTPSQPSL